MFLLPLPFLLAVLASCQAAPAGTFASFNTKVGADFSPDIPWQVDDPFPEVIPGIIRFAEAEICTSFAPKKRGAVHLTPCYILSLIDLSVVEWQ